MCVCETTILGGPFAHTLLSVAVHCFESSITILEPLDINMIKANIARALFFELFV